MCVPVIAMRNTRTEALMAVATHQVIYHFPYLAGEDVKNGSEC